MMPSFALIISGAPGNLALQARSGFHIPNERRRERPPIALLAAIELVREFHPDATLRSCSATYNCIGMVVASRRTTVEPSVLLRVLREDGHREIPIEETATGDVIVYRYQDEVTHAGVILSKNVVASLDADPMRVLSQWGADGEYEHDSLDVPDVYGRPAEYWTDRRIP